jgi:hypothetical protein
MLAGDLLSARGTRRKTPWNAAEAQMLAMPRATDDFRYVENGAPVRR